MHSVPPEEGVEVKECQDPLHTSDLCCVQLCIILQVVLVYVLLYYKGAGLRLCISYCIMLRYASTSLSRCCALGWFI